MNRQLSCLFSITSLNGKRKHPNHRLFPWELLILEDTLRFLRALIVPHRKCMLPKKLSSFPRQKEMCDSFRATDVDASLV